MAKRNNSKLKALQQQFRRHWLGNYRGRIGQFAGMRNPSAHEGEGKAIANARPGTGLPHAGKLLFSLSLRAFNHKPSFPSSFASSAETNPTAKPCFSRTGVCSEVAE